MLSNNLDLSGPVTVIDIHSLLVKVRIIEANGDVRVGDRARKVKNRQHSNKNQGHGTMKPLK